MLGNSKKSSTFAHAKQKLQRRERFKGESAAQQIGVWCNGNTADSGPAFPGSSPGTPTLTKASSEMRKSFFCVIYSTSCKMIRKAGFKKT